MTNIVMYWLVVFHQHRKIQKVIKQESHTRSYEPNHEVIICFGELMLHVHLALHSNMAATRRAKACNI